MLLGAAGTFCADTANVWQLVGYVVVIIKIVIPLMLIILGMVDLGKAVVSSDEKAINTAVGTLIRRFVIAIIIFFIPTIVNAVFIAVSVGASTKDGDGRICMVCVTDAMGAECEGYSSGALGIK